jgi:hypothetical protein
MKSALHASEVVANRNRRFGSATTYYPCRLIRADGSAAPMLFTEAELAVAVDRARANAEDIDSVMQLRRQESRSMIRTAALLVGAVFLACAILSGAILWAA